MNKCKRYANVPLYQFYVQMQKAEKQIYMVEKSSKRMYPLKKEEMVYSGFDRIDDEEERKAFLKKKENPVNYKGETVKPNKNRTEMTEEQYMCHRHCLDEKAAAA